MYTTHISSKKTKMLFITPYVKYSTQHLSEAPNTSYEQYLCICMGVIHVSTNTPNHNINMLRFFFLKKKKKSVMKTKSNILEASSIIQLINSSILFSSSILGRLEISMDCCVFGENVQVVGTLSSGYLKFQKWNFVNYRVGLNNSLRSSVPSS